MDSCYIYILNFFFQAEDGIRDRNVTGVQTCALPIFNPSEQVPPRMGQVAFSETEDAIENSSQVVLPSIEGRLSTCHCSECRSHSLPEIRSEERRVGKE